MGLLQSLILLLELSFGHMTGNTFHLFLPKSSSFPHPSQRHRWHSRPRLPHRRSSLFRQLPLLLLKLPHSTRQPPTPHLTHPKKIGTRRHPLTTTLTLASVDPVPPPPASKRQSSARYGRATTTASLTTMSAPAQRAGRVRASPSNSACASAPTPRPRRASAARCAATVAARRAASAAGAGRGQRGEGAGRAGEDGEAAETAEGEDVVGRGGGGGGGGEGEGEHAVLRREGVKGAFERRALLGGL